MKLIDATNTASFVELSDDFLWSDEFQWSSVATRSDYSLGGALIVESVTKLAGRPITLQAPDTSMAWVTRADILQLIAWANVPEKELTLQLEYASDQRVFSVMFAPGAVPIDSTPVLGYNTGEPTDYFTITLRLCTR